ncbi:MAG: arginine deiminase-related protein [Roseivirga sp.]
MSKQAAKTIMMMRPKHFGYDPASAETNAFQVKEGYENTNAIQQAALKEFDNAVATLKAAGVNVLVVEDSDSPVKPNAVFPNNWVSFHRDSKVVLYPMLAENRRDERRPEIFDQLKEQGVNIDQFIDLTHYEEENKFLESTGSVIFDYPCEIAYACVSARTHPEVLDKFSEIMGFEPVVFEALDKDGMEIYHTNVMMCLADDYVVICAESIREDQRKNVLDALEKTGHEVVPITFDQMYHFAGNMLEVENEAGQSILIMSEAAMHSLDLDQKERLSQYSRLLSVPIPTIEKYGGGSIRCMMCRVN